MTMDVAPRVINDSSCQNKVNKVFDKNFLSFSVRPIEDRLRSRF